MIKSELISNILELTVEGETFEKQLFEQIELLTESRIEHTGTGMYIYFDIDDKTKAHQLSKSQLKEMFGDFNHDLTKFELVNSSINVLADLTVHFTDGIIDCLEIWNKLGEYPKEELVTYQLKRIEG